MRLTLQYSLYRGSVTMPIARITVMKAFIFGTVMGSHCILLLAAQVTMQRVDRCIPENRLGKKYGKLRYLITLK